MNLENEVCLMYLLVLAVEGIGKDGMGNAFERGDHFNHDVERFLGISLLSFTGTDSECIF